MRFKKGSVEQDWILMKKMTLGTGFSGAVMMAAHKVTGVRAAVKTFEKKGAAERKLSMLKDELNV